MAFDPKDFYFKKAKGQNFAARSIFKLEEIDKRLKLIRPGNRVLDLGASPGSWSQYCADKVGEEGRVVAVDLNPLKISHERIEFHQLDMLSDAWEKIAASLKPFDLVISDMAPKTTGIKNTDQARSLELCEMAFEVARSQLRMGGSFICKIFQSGDSKGFETKIKDSFRKLEIIKPKATRQQSKEIFLVGIKKTK